MPTDSPSYVFAGVTRWKAGTQNGLFRMAVGEDRWERMGGGLPDSAFIMCITVHPADRALVFVGTQNGPYRSTDHGTTWKRMTFPEGMQVWSMAVHPGRADTVFAGVSPVAVYRSDDRGDSWRRMPGSSVADRLPMGSFVNRVMRMTVDPAKPDDIYAVMEANGAMASHDGGETWEDCNDDLIGLARRTHLKSAILTDIEDEGVLDVHAVCSTPAAPGKVFLASRMGVFEGSDGARRWRNLELGKFSPLTYGRDVRVSPHDPQTLYACLSDHSQGEAGSLYRSSDVGATWTRFDHSVTPKSTAMAVALDPRDPGIVHFITRKGQVPGTRDGGRSWRDYPLPSGSLGTYCTAGG